MVRLRRLTRSNCARVALDVTHHDRNRLFGKQKCSLSRSKMVQNDRLQEPVICDNLVLDEGDVVLCKMGHSPLTEIKHQWRKDKKKDQETFLSNPRWKDEIRSFLEELNQRPSCMDPFNPHGRSHCTCLSGMFTEEMKTSVGDEVFEFSLLDCQSTQLLVQSWIRHADVVSTTQRDRHLMHILPDTNDQLVRRAAVATQIGFGKKVWCGLVSTLCDGTSVDHGSKEKTSNHADARMQEHLQEFFSEMIQHALPTTLSLSPFTTRMWTRLTFLHPSPRGGCASISWKSSWDGPLHVTRLEELCLHCHWQACNK